MRLIVSLFLALGFFFFLNGCTKKYNASNLPEQQLRWGHGGGFTGQEITSILLANGQAFRSMGFKSPFEAIEGVKKKDAGKIFKAFKKIDLSKLPESVPGNRYNFLEFPDGKGAFLRVAFEDAASLPEDLKNLHNSLSKIGFVPPVVRHGDHVH